MNKYLVLNTADMNVLKTNGRIFSAKNADVKHNGVLGQIGALKEGEMELRDFVPATEETIRTQLPMICFAPEVNYDSSRFANRLIGNFRYHADLAFSVAPMTVADSIEVSQDFIVGGEDLKVGAIIKQVVGGGLEKVEVAPTSDEAMAYFVVTGVRNASTYQQPFGTGIAAAPAHKMYTIELVLA